MFYKYEVRNNGNEDILYLFLTMNYEFSKELGANSSDKELTRRTKNFIKNNNINFNGNRIYLVIDGIVVKSLDIASKKMDVEILKEELYYSNDHYMVNLKLENSSFIEISLNDYLLGTLAAVYDNNIELETLKAICVLFRTYAYKQMSEKKYIDSNNSFINYRPISYYKLSWINNFSEVFNKISLAISSTDCIFVSYNQHYILPFIHYSNHGKTLYNDNYKYLSSVNSLWDLAAPNYINIKDFSFLELSKLLKTNVNEKSIFKVIDVDNNGLINKIQIDNSYFIGDDLIKILDLKSKAISIIINSNYVRFISKGYGHFLGLSIYGSNEIAKNGCDYTNIIKYYFPKVKLNKYIKELS